MLNAYGFWHCSRPFLTSTYSTLPFLCPTGVSLCIGETILKPSDWASLFDAKALTLAAPGILAGIFLTVVSRRCSDEAVLPLSMVAIPALFYVVMFFSGMTIEEAREEGWVGEVSASLPLVILPT